MPFTYSFGEMLARTIDQVQQRKAQELRDRMAQEDQRLREASFTLAKQQYADQRGDYRNSLISGELANRALEYGAGGLTPPPASPVAAPLSAHKPKTYGQMIDEVAARLEAPPDALKTVMNFESRGFDTTAVNPYSGASGLIQFTPQTARNLGTTVEEIRRMSFEDQLKLTERYLGEYRGRMKTAEDVASAVFLPIMMGKDPTTPIPERYLGGNGDIATMADYYHKMRARPMNTEFLGRSPAASPVAARATKPLLAATAPNSRLFDPGTMYDPNKVGAIMEIVDKAQLGRVRAEQQNQANIINAYRIKALGREEDQTVALENWLPELREMLRDSGLKTKDLMNKVFDKYSTARLSDPVAHSMLQEWVTTEREKIRKEFSHRGDIDEMLGLKERGWWDNLFSGDAFKNWFDNASPYEKPSIERYRDLVTMGNILGGGPQAVEAKMGALRAFGLTTPGINTTLLQGE